MNVLKCLLFTNAQVFQPLLAKYFSQEELVSLKTLVIKLHMQQRKNNANSQDAAYKKEHPSADDATILMDRTRDEIQTSLHLLPDEILLKIFSNLTLGDKLKSARVCKRWNHLVYDKHNWNHLSFDDWKSSRPHTFLQRFVCGFFLISFLSQK